jgi:hypothetical protein
MEMTDEGGRWEGVASNAGRREPPEGRTVDQSGWTIRFSHVTTHRFLNAHLATPPFFRLYLNSCRLQRLLSHCVVLKSLENENGLSPGVATSSQQI